MFCMILRFCWPSTPPSKGFLQFPKFYWGNSPAGRCFHHVLPLRPSRLSRWSIPWLIRLSWRQSLSRPPTGCCSCGCCSCCSCGCCNRPSRWSIAAWILMGSVMIGIILLSMAAMKSLTCFFLLLMYLAGMTTSLTPSAIIC